MIKPRELMWIKRGKQKHVVFRVIVKPMSPGQILKASKEINPSITFGDVSNIIREGEKRDMLLCLTPDRLTGRIYFLTPLGRGLVANAYGIRIKKEARDIDWNKYAVVIAGKTRKYILFVLENTKIQYKSGITLMQVRRKVNGLHPIPLNQTLSSVRVLCKNRLVRLTSNSKKRRTKLYELTNEGIRMSEYLRENPQ